MLIPAQPDAPHRGTLLVGPSGVGKSLMHSARLSKSAPPCSESPDRSILYAAIPSKSTAKTIVIALLRAANDPRCAAREPAAQKSDRLVKLMGEQGTKLAFLDAMSHTPAYRRSLESAKSKGSVTNSCWSE